MTLAGHQHKDLHKLNDPAPAVIPQSKTQGSRPESGPFWAKSGVVAEKTLEHGHPPAPRPLHRALGLKRPQRAGLWFV